MCVLLSHVYLRKQKSTIMKSEGRTNIADKDKTRTKKRTKHRSKQTTSYGNYYSKKNKNMNISRNKKNTRIT